MKKFYISLAALFCLAGAAGNGVFETCPVGPVDGIELDKYQLTISNESVNFAKKQSYRSAISVSPEGVAVEEKIIRHVFNWRFKYQEKELSKKYPVTREQFAQLIDALVKAGVKQKTPVAAELISAMTVRLEIKYDQDCNIIVFNYPAADARTKALDEILQRFFKDTGVKLHGYTLREKAAE